MHYEPQIEPWPNEFRDKLPLIEMFYSIQGEGRFAGCPAVFIRLRYCNLGCAWCDTRFTWEKGNIEEGELPCGQNAGIITGITSASEVIESIVSGLPSVIANTQSKVPANNI